MRENNFLEAITSMNFGNLFKTKMPFSFKKKVRCFLSFKPLEFLRNSGKKFSMDYDITGISGET